MKMLPAFAVVWRIKALYRIYIVRLVCGWWGVPSSEKATNQPRSGARDRQLGTRKLAKAKAMESPVKLQSLEWRRRRR